MQTPVDHLPFQTPEVSILSSMDSLRPTQNGAGSDGNGVSESEVHYGISYSTFPPPVVQEFDRSCGALTDVEPEASDRETITASPFVFRVHHWCEGRDSGRIEIAREAEHALRQGLAHYVARAVWLGLPDSDNPKIWDAETINGGSAVSPVRGLGEALLAFQMRTNGARAFIHTDPAVLPYITQAGYADRVGNKLVTPSGHVVIGTHGNHPTDDLTPDSGEHIIAVTRTLFAGPADIGVVETTRDVRTGLYYHKIEASVLVAWDPQGAVAALVELPA